VPKANGNQKGKRGEREVANLLTANGFPARRGQQFSGSPDSPDVVCEIFGDCNIEAKYRETFSINDVYTTIDKAREDDPDRFPQVWYRKNGKKWIVIMEAEDFLNVIKN